MGSRGKKLGVINRGIKESQAKRDRGRNEKWQVPDLGKNWKKKKSESLVSSKLNIHYQMIWQNMLLGIYLPKGVENLSTQNWKHKDVNTTLFIMVKTWKQPRCPSLGE